MRYRYNARTEGKIVPVSQGTEHVVFHKTYERRHGDDHVRMVSVGISESVVRQESHPGACIDNVVSCVKDAFSPLLNDGRNPGGGL